MGSDETNKIRSSAEIDARLYKVLYDLELRLDNKFRQSKEDISATLRNMLEPVHAKLSTIDSSLIAGTKTFEEHNRQLSDNEQDIQELKMVIRDKKDADLSGARSAKKGGWVAIDKVNIPSLLQGIGILIATVLSAIALLRNPKTPSPEPALPPASGVTSP